MSTAVNAHTTHSAPGSKELGEERRELEAVAASLANAHRLQRLLAYIGEKYFNGETDNLHEYEIATEVFGRSKATFNPGDDAIVRVEAHRLRKRLRGYYENEGKDHRIQLSIPPGTYVPVFIRRSTDPQLSKTDTPVRQLKFPSWVYAAVVVSLALFAVAGYFLRSAHGAPKNAASAAPVPSIPASLPAGMAYAKVPLRICAGCSGKPQMDNEGAVWQPDEYFQQGGTWAHTQSLLLRTNNPTLFEHWRNGNFSYNIPLRPGVYELHLYFSCQDLTPSGPEAFSVSVNGKKLLTGFDINSDAMGTNVADERVFRDISPGPDGILHINFDSEGATPTVNAIEILPGLPGKLLPVRIVTQPTSFTDHNGQFWHADNYYMGGYSSEKRLTVTDTSDPGLYAAERFGHFSYAIPVDPRDQYTLVLHFAELYFGSKASGSGGIGSRVFRVSCNGESLLRDFDIYNEAGSLTALTKTFHHLKPSAQGKLNITFEPIANNATVSAIEVIDEAE